MRLFELLENVPASITTKPMSRPHENADKNRLTIAGRGQYSDVYQDRDNPHEVMKFSNFEHSPEEDGYLKYIREIANDTNIQSNLWVPRILSFRVHRHKTGEPNGYTARIESLSNFGTMNLQELDALNNRMFVPSLAQKLLNIFRPEHQKSIEPSVLLEKKQRKVLENIEYCIHRPNKAHKITIDEHLIEFVKWHAEAFKRHADEHFLDIAFSNLMIRRTPYGIQPVITDPWA